MLDANDNLVATCTDLPTPMYQPESDCSNARGRKVKIQRTCSACKLGTVNIGILTSDCGTCLNTLFDSSEMNFDYYVTEFLDLTDDVALTLKLG